MAGARETGRAPAETCGGTLNLSPLCTGRIHGQVRHRGFGTFRTPPPRRTLLRLALRAQSRSGQAAHVSGGGRLCRRPGAATAHRRTALDPCNVCASPADITQTSCEGIAAKNERGRIRNEPFPESFVAPAGSSSLRQRVHGSRSSDVRTQCRARGVRILGRDRFAIQGVI